MAYDKNKLTKLQALKDLGKRVKKDYDALAKKVEVLETAGGQKNVLEGVKVNGVALSIAEKMVDILIASGSEEGTLSVNSVNVAVAGLKALAFKAEVSEAELSEALKAIIAAKAEASDVIALTEKVTTLIGEDVGKSARTIANEELAKQLIPENAKESLDSLTELAAWIQKHPDDAAAMNAAIAALQSLIGTIPEDAESETIVDFINEVASTKVSISDIATDEECAEMLDEVFGS